MKLFRDYKASSDNNVVQYIDKKEEAYLNGKDFESDELMQVVLNKYIILKQNGEWTAPSTEQKQLTDLTTEQDKFKNDSKKKSTHKPNDQNKDKKTEKGKKNPSNDEKWTWKKIYPANEEDYSKQMAEKTYDWCIKHQAWTVHTPENCTLPPLNRNKPKTRASTSSKHEDSLQAVIEEVGSKDE